MQHRRNITIQMKKERKWIKRIKSKKMEIKNSKEKLQG